MIRSTKGLLKDVRGVSAVEFALVVPALITLYFGVAELTQAMMADRRAIHVASAIGDLASQDDQITNADMADIFKVGAIVLSPFPTTSLQMRISQLTTDVNGVAKVSWSDGSGITARTVGSTVVPPTGVVGASQSVVLSEIFYSYTSPVGYIMPAPVNFSKSFYLRPRKTDTIARVP
jgi:Flp pilus assembly protein TadG